MNITTHLSHIIQIKKGYLLTATAILLVEVTIALWVHDSIIRPHVGDFLVAILLYCTFRGVFVGNTLPFAIGAVGICFVVETLQAFHIADKLGLSICPIAVIIIGTQFSIVDLVAYTLGGVVVVLWDIIYRHLSGPKMNNR